MTAYVHFASCPPSVLDDLDVLLALADRARDRGDFPLSSLYDELRGLVAEGRVAVTLCALRARLTEEELDHAADYHSTRPRGA